MPAWLLAEEHARAFVAVVAAASAAVAAGTFLVSLIKNRGDRRQQQSFKAREIWAEYMKLAFDHPQFSGGFDYDESEDSTQKEKYEWFVSLMLYACEEVMSYSGGDPRWNSTFLLQFSYHKRYFCAGHFDEAITGYSKALFDLFSEWRAKACPTP